MGEKTLDMRGRPCPLPVVESRKVLLAPDTRQLCVLVDDRDSADNIVRMATTLGWRARIGEQAAGTCQVFIDGVGASAPAATAAQEKAVHAPSPGSANVVFLITSSCIGEGNEELGRILMRGFVKTIKQLATPPRGLLFLNRGVELTTEGSDLLVDLQAIEAEGVELLTCGTCLDYFHKKEELRAGRVSNMFEILSWLTSADSVVRL